MSLRVIWMALNSVWVPLRFGLVLLVEVCRRDFQAGLSCGPTNPASQDQQRAQDVASPSGRNLTEQPMLDRIPLGGSGGVMADRDSQPAVVRELLPPLLVAP